jgi:class 3 adenylate cyclase/tetratricopeptide (TPR) repeat protein
MRQERKVVTVLFCDLVGFTSQAEEMDPEDVAAMLTPYHARLKQELERYGGTVEKFIGDAVMALFGAPVAHEDDPERAVRAALAIRDYGSEEGIELRIGITSGEALINLDARPDAGETMATGDVVNTAARLQSAAPVGGILVSEKTYEATKQAVEYGAAEAVEAKGKARHVPVWEVLSAAPLQERAHTTPLVGREQELDQLRAALSDARDGRTPELVTLVGEPGIGKSRLVYELSQMDAGARWRKGRCLPYGGGVRFWALGEIVKAELGILESDTAETAEAKLTSAVDDAWVAGHLRTLMGIGDERQAFGHDRAETFAAWRRFLTMLAEEQPLILVFEDVHWADDGLLDFVTHLVDWAQGSPLFVLCTARQELLERRPGWGATIVLSPLSDLETSRLLSALVAGDASQELVARTAGNPLYAEQYARLAAEGRSLDELPTNVQGIIAARLDGLRKEERGLLQDAAVVGEVFWSSAVAALAGTDRWSVEEQLLTLERRELVHRERTSSIDDETEYRFAHILVRDVAYGAIPRAQRATKHLFAAEWLERLGRADDRAEVLAHHYLEALGLTRAAGGDVAAFADRARMALREAGDRALSLNAFVAAESFFAIALDLLPAVDADRGALLFALGRSQAVGRGAGEETLAEARQALLDAGDVETAAEAEMLASDVWRLRAEGARAQAHLGAAVVLVRDRPPSLSKARILSEAARFRMLAFELEEAVEFGQEACVMAETLGIDEVRAKALDIVGTSRMMMGDLRGRDDLELAIELGTELNSVEGIRAVNNLGSAFIALGDLREAARVWDSGQELTRRLGGVQTQYLELNRRLNQAYWSGSWREVVDEADRLISEWESGVRYIHAVWAYDLRGRIRLATGDLAGCTADTRKAADVARTTNEPQLLIPVLAFGAVAFVTSGQEQEAMKLADEVLGLRPARRPVGRFSILFDLSVALTELGRVEELFEETAQADVRTPWIDAAEAYARGELERAAEIYARSGALPLEAYCRLRTAKQLVAEGRRHDADAQLEQAVAFWRSVGANRYIAQCEELLAGSA